MSQAEAEAHMRMQMQSAHAENLADCKHLEVTLQTVRCEHTAADTALASALQVGDSLTRHRIPDPMGMVQIAHSRDAP